MTFKFSYVKYLFRKDFHYVIAGFVLAILIKMLKPIVEIKINAWWIAKHIGHLASESDVLLAEKYWGFKRDGGENIFYLSYLATEKLGDEPVVANKYLYDLLKKLIPGLRFSKIISYMVYVNIRLFDEFPGSFGSYIPCASVDRFLFTSRTPPHVKIKKKNRLNAEKKVSQFGVHADKPTMLFFNRDTAYQKAFLKQDTVISDYRNSPISSYIPMALDFLEKGYNCVRMGAYTEEKIDPNLGIVDYSFYEREENIELYLYSICKFSVSDITGLNSLPSFFRKPRVLLNNAPLLNFYTGKYFMQCIMDSIITFKKNWCEHEKRVLNLSELLSKGLLRHKFDPLIFLTVEDFKRENVSFINNTPEEIKEVALEMHLRLNGEWEETEEDIILQHRFWKNLGVKRDTMLLSHYPRVGAHFLRNNEWLLK